jgi:chromosome segregation ATPase
MKFYSEKLDKLFETEKELVAAEKTAEKAAAEKAKKAEAKKAEAKKVEDAFKALNAARKAYKEEMAQLTKDYSKELDTLKKAFELAKKDIQNKLAEAEDNFAKAHKEFTDAHPEGYHLTLKDGDFETTISGSGNRSTDLYTEIMKIYEDVRRMGFNLT